MSEFKQYRRSQIAELRPYVPGESLDRVSISAPDREAGSPKEGDMVARNPKNHADQWLVAAQYFADNFEPLEGGHQCIACPVEVRGLYAVAHNALNAYDTWKQYGSEEVPRFHRKIGELREQVECLKPIVEKHFDDIGPLSGPAAKAT